MPSALLTAIEHVGDTEVHTLPSGTTVAYRDRDHSYWTSAAPQSDGTAKCSGRLTGVSTVVSPLDFYPEHLIRWAARMQCEGIAALYAGAVAADTLDELRSSLQWLTSSESIDAALANARLRYSDRRDDAATRGTNVHKHALHALAEGEPVPRRGDLTDEEWGYARGVMAFWHECEPDPIAAEFVVCDPDLGVAGRADLLAEITHDGVRQRVLLDAKTSGFIPVKHHGQLALYAHCAAVSGYGNVDLGLILQVDAHGRYRLIPVCATEEDARAAVDLYRRAGRIKRDLTATQKAAA